MIIMEKTILEIKQRIKKTSPNFTRSDNHKKPKLSRSGWRKPKGIQNKMRLQLRGYKRIVKTGYGTPNVLKHLVKGKVSVHVSNLKDLEKATSKSIAIFNSTLGAKKKIDLLEACKKRNIEVFNFKDSAKYLDDIKSKLKSKSESTKNKIASRLKKKQAADKLKKTEEKKSEKSVEEKVTDEEKKIKDKKEKDKVLITKE